MGFSLGSMRQGWTGVPVADAQPTIRIKELTVGYRLNPESLVA